jgi:two-component sensor histidine kinase
MSKRGRPGLPGPKGASADRRSRASKRRTAAEELAGGGLLWHDEATLLARLSEHQTRLVSDTLKRAARSDRIAREKQRLARDLEGSRDRLQEVHHRVRNHLQMVTGLLSAQEVSEQSPTARRALQRSVARLTSVAAIHDLLARDPGSGKLRLPELAEQLSRHLLTQAGAEHRLQVRLDVAALDLPPREATAFVLILTELLTNAVEHGFPADGSGQIQVRVAQHQGRAVLEVADTGRGLPEGFDLGRAESLGLRLVGRLAERDLGGAAEAWNGPRRDKAQADSSAGACFRVEFPVPA